MTLHRLAALLTAIVLLSACGPPVVDTASTQRLQKSVEKMRLALDAQQLQAFDDAFAYLSNDAQLSGDAQALEKDLEACAGLAGMTAEQIIHEAWSTRVARIGERIAELEAKREAGAGAREMLDRLELIEARLYPPSPGFLERGMVEVEVANHTGHRLNQISFQASLRRQGELEPVVVELVHRPFGSGLAPGKQVQLRLELTDKEWRQASGGEAAFGCCVVALEDRRNQRLAATDFGAVEDYLLDALGQRLAELEAQQPAP